MEEDEEKVKPSNGQTMENQKRKIGATVEDGYEYEKQRFGH